MKIRFSRFSLGALLIFVPGCANFYRPPLAPSEAYSHYLLHKYSREPMDVNEAAAAAHYEELGSRYKHASDSDKKKLRNQIVNDLIYLINDYYDKYEIRWFATASGIGAASDIATLGLDTIVAASSGAQIRTILSAISTGIGGSRLALEKDVLKNQSITVIIHTMRATREKQYSDLQLKLKAQNAADYPLEEALIDVQNYFHAGTVIGALQQLDDAAANTARLANDLNDQKARLKSLVEMRAAIDAARAGTPKSAATPAATPAPVP